MITEAQRRALFALREALHLCEGAKVWIDANGGESIRLWVAYDCKLAADRLRVSDLNQLLEAHPDV